MPPATRPAAAASSTPPSLPRAPRRLRRRRALKAAQPAATPAAGGAAASRGGGPSTPHLRWDARGGEGNAGAEKPRGGPPSSVRWLAAAVWRLRPPEEAPAAGQRADATAARVGLEVRVLPTPRSPFRIKRKKKFEFLA